MENSDTKFSAESTPSEGSRLPALAPGPAPTGPLIDSCLICRGWLWRPGFLCRKCWSVLRARPLLHRHDRGLDVFSLCQYVAPIDQIMRMGKQARIPELTVALATMAADKLALECFRPVTAVVPMPPKSKGAHKDHAFLIAETAAKILRAPLYLNFLEREQNSAGQKEKNVRERKRKTIKAGKETLDWVGLGGDDGLVLLIDDVVTSGATLFQAWNTLRRPPAIALTIASTPLWSLVRDLCQ